MEHIRVRYNNHYELGSKIAHRSLSKIKLGLRKYNKILEDDISMSLKEFSKIFLEGTSYLEDAKTYAPNTFDEMKGMADIIGITLGELLTYSAIDETPVFINQMLKNSTKITDQCSSIGYFNDKIFLAQNNDLPTYVDDTQVVVSKYCEANGKAYITGTLAGMVSQCGLNNCGLAVTVNTLSMLKLGKSGLIGTIVLNELLQKNSVLEAINWLSKVVTCGGVNYCLADKEHMVSVETSFKDMVVIEKEDSKNHITHTNHPFKSKNFDVQTTSYKIYNNALTNNTDTASNSFMRNRACDEFMAVKEIITLEELQQLLITKPIMNFSKEMQHGTVLSTIADVSNLQFWILSDPRHDKVYKKIEF